MIILACILGLLVILSLWFATSGYVPGRTNRGWILLLVFMIFYLEFAYLLVKRAGSNPFDRLFAMLGLLAIIVTQVPLLAELIAQSVVPDRSRGLKIIEVHSEAESKVARDDFPGAIAEYEKIVARNADDITARFRLAELCWQGNEYLKAASAYENVLEESEKIGIDRHCSVLTRLAEIHENKLNDSRKARSYIQAIVDQYPGSKYAGYAMERLDNF